jgi:hypothetical protein
VGCAAGLVARGRGGEAGEVGFGEEERVEPVDAAFVAGEVLVTGQMYGNWGGIVAYAFRR